MNEQKQTIVNESEKINKRKVFGRVIKLAILFLILLLSIIYFVLYVINSKDYFTVTLDQNASNRKVLYLSEHGGWDGLSIKLTAESPTSLDNVTERWYDFDEIEKEADGSHNFDNKYIAYSFYVVNYSVEDTISYYYEIDTLDAIKDADEAMRIRVYLNGKDTTYAKLNRTTGRPEEGTTAFYADKIPVLEERKNLGPREQDRFTIIFWLEGEDPDCVNDILGGKVKFEMNIREEHLSDESQKEVEPTPAEESKN
jgi:hypothetical protein